ncbi:MAG TPA: acyl-CoA dehydrogenase family protein [Sporichthyaceae bacterium]|jgi:alkylation response protein AidB-like acyl-CoA dehydrogenase
MAIDFTLTPEQQALQGDARGFAAAVLSEVRALIDPLPRPEDRFFATQPIYAQMAKGGFVHALFPQAYGGGGLSALDFAIAAEELTRVDINVPTTLLATGLGMEPILGFGTEEQKRQFVSEILAEPENRLASFAFTEVAGGANFDCPDPAAGVQTSARLDGDEWVINGQKHFTTNGSGWDGNGAHLFTVVCRTDLTKPPAQSLAVIVVPGATPGVEVVGYLDTAGHRAVASPRVHFHDVRVPAGNILGKPGDGEAICRRSFSWTAAMIGSACVGVMRAAFDEAFEFAKTDKRSGNVPVIEHQNAGYMLADLKMRIEAARYLTWKACHQLDLTERRSDELAIMTKVYCSELAVQVVYDAMRLVGVNSYSDLSPLSGLMQDALCFPLYDGGNMGVRRRQLHTMFKSPGYDPMASAEAR